MARLNKAAEPYDVPGVVLPAEAWEHVDRGEQELQHALRVIAAAEKCGVACEPFRKLAKELGAGFAAFRKQWEKPDAP